MRRMMSILLLAVLALTVLVCPALAAGSKTDPVEIVETERDGEHQDWTETKPSVILTPEDAAKITGIPLKEVSILWQTDYSTPIYPANITVSAPGTDDLPVYVLEYVNGEWIILGSGTGPTVIVPIGQDGPLAFVTRVPVTYEVTKGMNGVWYQTTTVSLPFTCERSIDDPSAYSHFTGIEVDGKTVDPSHYTAVSGSVVLELHPEFLSTLALGEHSLMFLFDDGQAGTQFFVRPISEAGLPAKDTTAKAPRTGDNGWLIATGIITIVAIGGALALTRRKQN